MAIAGLDPHHEPIDAAKTMDETSAATEWHQSLYRSRHRSPCGYLPHSVSSVIMAFILLISHLHDVTNEPYGNAVRPANDDTRKADQAHQDRVDDTVGQQVAASSSGGGEDGEEEEDDHLWKRKIQNTRCSGDERPSGRNDNDHEHNDENGFMGEHQSMYLGETILMTFPTLFVRATLSFMRIASWRWVESTRPKRKT